MYCRRAHPRIVLICFSHRGDGAEERNVDDVVYGGRLWRGKVPQCGSTRANVVSSFEGIILSNNFDRNGISFAAFIGSY